jgi:acyl carrier protein
MSYRNDIADFFESELGLEAGTYQDDELLFSSGRLDSFGLIDVMAFVEKKLGRRLKTAETTLANFDSVTKLSDFMAAA